MNNLDGIISMVNETQRAVNIEMLSLAIDVFDALDPEKTENTRRARDYNDATSQLLGAEKLALAAGCHIADVVKMLVNRAMVTKPGDPIDTIINNRADTLLTRGAFIMHQE